jgi:SAM-dependent methyltransferase
VRQNFKLNVRAGSLVEQKYPADYYDAIVLSHVIEHVHDPCVLLTECCRILKPEGKVILLTPNIESLGYQTFGSDWVHLDPPRHLHLFSPTTLRTLGENSGLTIMQVKTNARDANNTWVMSRNIGRIGKCHAVDGSGVVPKLQSKFFQIKEYIVLSKDSSAGDEILMIATKKASL